MHGRPDEEPVQRRTVNVWT